jgi:nucleoid-associated protein YgaU
VIKAKNYMKETKRKKKNSIKDLENATATVDNQQNMLNKDETTPSPVVVAPNAAAHSFKERLNALMQSLKQENPLASWKNLILGMSVVLLVIFSSLLYFNRLSANTTSNDAILNLETNSPSTITPPVEIRSSTNKSTTEDKYVTVLDGEGLWNVAERICKDGEKYTVLAQANGLDPESAVNPGQRLLVKCN